MVYKNGGVLVKRNTSKNRTGTVVRKAMLIIMLIGFVIPVTILMKYTIESESCNIQVEATPVYADPYEGIFSRYYDYTVTYMYSYDGANKIGSDYASEEEIEDMKGSKITIWVSKKNPDKSYFNKKKDIRTFCYTMIAVCIIGILCALPSAPEKSFKEKI